MTELYFSKLKEDVENIWWKLPTKYEKFEIKYHKRKDKALLDINNKLINHIKTINIDNNDEILDESLSNEMISLIKNFVENNLSISVKSMDVIFNEEYLGYSEEFMKRAKELDNTLNMTSIFQGLRNVWTMHSMQIYLNKEVLLTDSVFAYSMLYPLTDNFLDDPSLSKEEKFDFNKRFRIKIATGSSQYFTKKEEQIFMMIDLIESEWDRNEHPMVYKSLLAILDGQNLSLKQQHLKSVFTEGVFGITVYKGGASVLADAYLVAGALTAEEEKFAFYYGVVLQLADDLQDIKEDLKSEHYTIMNIQSAFGILDDLFQKYLNLIDYFLTKIYSTETENQKALIELTRESIQLLIFAAILKTQKLVSKDLYTKVKNNSNFSLKVYKKTEKSFNKQLKILIKKD